jgi:hypothetical protein
MLTEEQVLEILSDLGDALESLAVNLKRQIMELGLKEGKQAAVKEETFTFLKFESQEGAKIGAFDVAYEKTNIPEKWNSAFNILKQSNSTINSRYHGANYEFSYWLFGEGKIYRQKLKKA